MIVIAGATIGYLQSDKAQQLARKEVEIQHARANGLGELSRTRLSSGQILSALRLAAQGARTDLALPSQAVNASPAAAALATTIEETNWRAFHGLSGDQVLSRLPRRDWRLMLGGHDDIVWSAAFSPDGSRIVTASKDMTARIWDAATAKEITVLHGHDDSVSSAAFSPDGSHIVTASWDGTARIWNAATAREIAILRGHHDAVISAAFSPDGSHIVTASRDGTVRLWDASTTSEIAVLRGDTFSPNAAFSFDGSRILTVSGRTARIWDADRQGNRDPART